MAELKLKDMKPQLIFSFLRISVKVLLIFMIVITALAFISSVSKFYGIQYGFNDSGLTYDVRKFGEKIKPQATVTSDNLIRFIPITDRYKVEIEPKSALGYYTSVSRIIFLSFGVVILYLFSKIFGEARLKDTFIRNVYRRLILLAAVFAISDVFKIAHYIIFNKLMHKSVTTEHFELFTDVGNGLINGLVIYAIAIIYHRGLSIADENALTI